MKGYIMIKNHIVFIRFGFNEFHDNTSVDSCMETIAESLKADLGQGNIRLYENK